ncbi:hypothetical protein PG991_003517 [Apiospora marii]|uniref:Uncharacterized protein n=1 Tax=Apiospora marii TaxID=335849 RepID=A0ABR1S428_9PEZI
MSSDNNNQASAPYQGSAPAQPTQENPSSATVPYRGRGQVTQAGPPLMAPEIPNPLTGPWIQQYPMANPLSRAMVPQAASGGNSRARPKPPAPAVSGGDNRAVASRSTPSAAGPSGGDSSAATPRPDFPVPESGREQVWGVPETASTDRHPMSDAAVDELMEKYVDPCLAGVISPDDREKYNDAIRDMACLAYHRYGLDAIERGKEIRRQEERDRQRAERDTAQLHIKKERRDSSEGA